MLNILGKNKLVIYSELFEKLYQSVARMKELMGNKITLMNKKFMIT